MKHELRVFKDLIVGLEFAHVWTNQLEDACAVKAQDEREFGGGVWKPIRR